MNKISPSDLILNSLKDKETFVFLDTRLVDKDNFLSYVFTDPLDIISSHEPQNIKSCLRQLQKIIDEGYYASGFLSYEAGYSFEDIFLSKTRSTFPLLWMGIFKKPLIFNHTTGKFINNNFDFTAISQSLQKKAKHKIKNLHLNISRRKYLDDIKKIKHLISAGDTYQVNHTMKYKFNFKGSPFALYQDLRNNQPVSYSAFIRNPDFNILSFSPELFFRQNNCNLTVKPMKGTIKRGKTRQEDKINKNNLRNDLKNKAENIMIVDLLRNDLGKISKTGSVKTSQIFNVEEYKTLLQMTSTVTSKIKKNISLDQLFSGIFPSGSITGAPKIHTMQIIKNIEKEKRNIYTGSIGFISPTRKTVFNVAIRTILLQKNKGEMGIGSGITYSSKAQSEYSECKLKAQFLKQPTFKLIETILWSETEGFPLLAFHLKRLKKSAGFFGFVYNKNLLKKQLREKVKRLSQDKNYKIRLLLHKNGALTIASTPLVKPAKTDTPQVILSPHTIHSDNTFFYHKTTRRRLYNNQYRRYKQQGFHDVIFLNKKNEITEGTISNIFIKKKGVFYTPPISCGLLPGTFREYFLKQNPEKTREKILTEKDLQKADAIYCTNAVQGMVKVRLV
ncbi:MAG: aminodeoxychorismate synthase component I [PVC group bacterium]|nr:aminodeoxychorismate synthase component I [PVC group bacterium]